MFQLFASLLILTFILCLATLILLEMTEFAVLCSL